MNPDIDGLRELARDLFATDDNPGIDLGQPPEKRSNTVALEGANPAPAPITDDARSRDFSKRFFDPDYASYQQEFE